MLLTVLGVYICAAVGMLVIAAAKCNEAERFRSALQRAALAAGGRMFDVSRAEAGDEAERQREWLGAVALKVLISNILAAGTALTNYENVKTNKTNKLRIG